MDLLGKRAPFYEDAARLFALSYYKRAQLIVSPITYATASYLLSKNNNVTGKILCYPKFLL